MFNICIGQKKIMLKKFEEYTKLNENGSILNKRVKILNGEFKDYHGKVIGVRDYDGVIKYHIKVPKGQGAKIIFLMVDDFIID